MLEGQISRREDVIVLFVLPRKTEYEADILEERDLVLFLLGKRNHELLHFLVPLGE